MSKRSLVAILVVVGIILGLGISNSFAIEKIEPDQKAVKLISDFFTALATKDDAARIKALIPLVHKTLLTKDGNDLAQNIKEFSYKKALQGYTAYAQPVKITEVHKGNVTTVGFKETAEKGRTDKYFCAKKEGVAGMPAPVKIFWPDGGGEPKIIDFGSL